MQTGGSGWCSATNNGVSTQRRIWAVFDNDDNSPSREMTDQIQEAVRQVSQLPDDKNPVKKVVLVFVSRNKGELYLDELEGDESGDG
jgi:hypothetical protein